MTGDPKAVGQAASTPHVDKVLAIDPGKDKCGVAVVARNGAIIEHSIVPTGNMAESIPLLAAKHAVVQVVLGHSTTSKAMLGQLETWLPGVPCAVVDETGSTLEARALYWQANPPRGWRRVVPLSLQAPPEAVDDFAAVILARRFFTTSGVSSTP